MKIIIIGAGETAAIAYEYFTHDSSFEVVAFSVQKKFLKMDIFCNLPVIAFENVEECYPPNQYKAFVAISSTKLNRIRMKLFDAAKNKGYECVSYISSNAFVWHNSKIGENCFIFENNTIQPFVKIEDNVVLWSGNHIGHNSTIRRNCFISSHVVVSGYCDIGESCFLGVNSTVINNIRVANDCFIGAGALIQKDTEEGGVYQTSGTTASRVGSLRLFRVKE